MQDRRARGARRGVRPARARADRPRRHERRRRALQGRQEARHQADRRLRGLLRRRPQGRPAAGASSATTSRCSPRPTRATATSSSSPRAGFLEGLQRGKPTSTWAARRPRRGRHRAHRLPGQPLLPAPDRRPRRTRRAPTPTTSSQAFGRRATSTSRSRRTASRAGPGQRGRSCGSRARSAARSSAPADVHYLRARGLPPPHGAAVRADEVDAADAEDDASRRTSSS